MEKLNASQFKEMLKSGAANLENNRAVIDSLNVFPVPDGDTGTNMSMTFTNGYLEAAKCYSDSICDVAQALSKGLLMGARGNSGVITSQIFRGFFQKIDGKDEIDARELAEAFENGARVAYKAIMKPVEGTILTVIRESSWYANHDFETVDNMSIEEYFDRFYTYMLESLDRTPDLLPVLKEVGVVDSGGAGLSKIIEGFKLYIEGSPVEAKEVEEQETASPALDLEGEEFGYCTEFIFRISEENLKSFDENVLKKKLSELGESLVVVRDEDLVKVHVHTLKPGDALNTAQRYGEFIKLKIENMSEQHSTIIANAKKEEVPVKKDPKKYGIITVAAGKGISDLFIELGADVVVSGGQTMNPSTEDFVGKIKELDHCEHIFIFPNNSNIIMAAQQAKMICEDQDVTVVSTKSVQAGLSCLSMFNTEGDVEENLATCDETIAMLQDASVTYAIKDTSYEGIEVKEGDYIAMTNKTIIASSKDRMETIKKLLDNMLTDSDAGLLTVIVGEDGNDEEAAQIAEYAESVSDVETNVITGDQPVYCYLFGLE